MNPSTTWFESAAGGLAAAWQFLDPWLTWESLKSFGNSAFTISLVGALAGAYFGARSAQRVAERSKLRDEMNKEVRNTNAAIALAFGVVNGMLALKKQHVAAVHQQYNEERRRHEEWKTKRRTGQIPGNTPYDLKADFRSLLPVSQPIAVLRDIVFSRISTTGRALNLVATLGETLDSLNTAIAQRNELIELFKAGEFPPGADLPSMYLALPYGRGHVNQQYADLMDGIASYTDDAIFFSRLLCQDLKEHGEGLVATYRKLLREGAPRITDVDFKEAEASGLMPKDDDYPTWFTAFRKMPKPTARRWWRRAP